MKQRGVVFPRDGAHTEESREGPLSGNYRVRLQVMFRTASVTGRVFTALCVMMGFVLDEAMHSDVGNATRVMNCMEESLLDIYGLRLDFSE